MLALASDVATRTPHFCAGCPHNTSTKVPEGMRAYAGIGCHYMAQWMDRETDGFTQMGGEGANWVGESQLLHPRATSSRTSATAPTTTRASWRCAGRPRPRRNVTYKILFNDAVAMTGGQRHEGGLTVDMIARQVRAEGVERIAVVTDEPGKYPSTIGWPSGTTVHRREDLDAVQRELVDGAGRLGADLRPDLRLREAAAAQAGRVRRSRQARHHQRARLRGLRRLLRAVELRRRAAGRDRVRPQAPDRPVELQQGFLLRQGLLPVLRDGARARR